VRESKYERRVLVEEFRRSISRRIQKRNEWNDKEEVNRGRETSNKY